MCIIIPAEQIRCNGVLHPFDTDRAEVVILGAMLSGWDFDLLHEHFISPTWASVFTLLSGMSPEDRRYLERRLGRQIEADDARELADVLSGAPFKETVVPAGLRDVYAHRSEPPDEAVAWLREARILRLLISLGDELIWRAEGCEPCAFILARTLRALTAIDRLRRLETRGAA